MIFLIITNYIYFVYNFFVFIIYVKTHINTKNNYSITFKLEIAHTTNLGNFQQIRFTMYDIQTLFMQLHFAMYGKKTLLIQTRFTMYDKETLLRPLFMQRSFY